MFTREELAVIKVRAVKEVDTPGMSRDWKRAYENLIDAADRLDAMIARSEVSKDDSGEHLPGK